MPPRQRTYTQAERDQFAEQRVLEALANQNQARPCTYKEFLSCNPPNFNGTEGAVGLNQWVEKMESVFRLCNCPNEHKVKYSTCTLQENALTWWNCYSQTLGTDTACQLPWEELKRIMRDEYCPSEEIQKLENELWHLVVKDNDITSYTNRFHQLALLCPTMVNPETKRIERYIGGLPMQIEGMVTASKPATIHKAIRIAHQLMAQVVRRGTPATENTLVKWNGDSSSNNDLTTQPEPLRFYTIEPNKKRGYEGNQSFCHGCKRHHDGSCGLPCERCQRYGHKIQDCRVPANPDSQRVCFKCKEPGHYKKDCPQRKRKLHTVGHE